MKEIIHSDLAPAAVGPYSQAVLANGVLYSSGQIAIGYFDADIKTQTAKVCENLAAVLEAAGMKLENVVKTTCFLANMEDFAAFNEIYEGRFNHRPARSCVAAKALPKGALVEIEVIATA